MKTRMRFFTLIELLITLSIISLLAGMALPSLQSARERGKFARWLTWKNQMKNDDKLLVLYDFQTPDPKAILNQAFGLERKYYNQRKLDAAIANGRWAWGRFKGKPGVVFDGISTFAQIGDDNKLGDIIGDVTISMWLKANSLSAQSILMRFYNEDGKTSNMDISLRNGSLRIDYNWFNTTTKAGNSQGAANSSAGEQGNGNAYAYGLYKNRDKTTLKNASQNFTTNIVPQKWYNVIITFSETNNRLQLYLNNKLMDQVTVDGPICFYVGKSCIGGLGQPGQAFNGIIDEIDIFNKEFTAREVNSYYSMSSPL